MVISVRSQEETMPDEESFMKQHSTLMKCVAFGTMIALITVVSFVINVSILGDIALDPVIQITAGILATPGIGLLALIAYLVLKPALKAYRALKNGEALSDEDLIEGTRAVRRFPTYLASFAGFWCFVPVPISFLVLRTWYGFSDFFGFAYIIVGIGTSLIMAGTVFHFSKSIEDNRIRHMLGNELAKRGIDAGGLKISQRLKLTIPILTIGIYVILPSIILAQAQLERTTLKSFEKNAQPLLNVLSSEISRKEKQKAHAILDDYAATWQRSFYIINDKAEILYQTEQLTPEIESRLATFLDQKNDSGIVSGMGGAHALYFQSIGDNKYLATATNWEDSVSDLWSRAIKIAISAMILVGITTYFIASDAHYPLKVLLENISRVRAGHLERPQPIITEDEYADISVALGDMTQELSEHITRSSEMVIDVRKGGELLNNSIDDIASIAREQNTGATQQAAAVRQMLSTAEEFTATSKQISERTLGVRTVAEETLTAARGGVVSLEKTREGITAVSEFMTAIADKMHNLEMQTQRIDDVLRLIEDVTETTDLLSLNASLEAAGAGTEGKRFGVVAGEIRRLAERTNEGATEVKALVAAIQEEVSSAFTITEQGTKEARNNIKQVETAENAFSAVTALSQETHEATQLIVTSAKEQATAFEQMTGTIGEINDVSQQALDGAIKLENSSTSLYDLSASMQYLVEQSEAVLKDAVTAPGQDESAESDTITD